MTDYRDIVEVKNVGHRLANYYLSQGYVLLGFGNETRSGRHPGTPGVKEDGMSAGAYYVRHSFVYVLGRPSAVKEPSPMPTDWKEATPDEGTAK